MSQLVYTDSLVRITEDSILFEKYYFPFGSKKIELSAIEHVEIYKPSLFSGKWRIHGSGDFRTWFPRDLARPKRDRIFILQLHNKWRRIGFTVEDSAALINIFKDRNMLFIEKQPDNSFQSGS